MKVLPVIGASIATMLVTGFIMGHIAGSRTAAPQAATSAQAAKPGKPAPAAVAAPAPEALSLAKLRPFTGPDRPPLPEDDGGPYGSRRITGTSEVALTFDDGPDPQWTPQVLDLLAQYRVKATFCVLGWEAESFPDLIRRIAAEGHTLCNHTWAHDMSLGRRGDAAILSDMVRTSNAIRAAVPNARISYFRHPGGYWTPNAVAVARQLGMTALHWDVDPRDWLKPGSYAISSAIDAGTRPGSIVLMHDGGGDRRGTVDALRTILPNLVSRLQLVALPPGIDPPRLYGIDLPVHIGQT